MKKKNIDWEDLIDSDDEKPKKPSPSRTPRPAPSAPVPTASTPAANTPASRASAISTWQNFHVQAQARQDADTAHLPSDYPVPSETSSANSGRSAPAGSLHRQGSSYRPERFDALIRRAQNQAPARSKGKVRSQFASSVTTTKRVIRFTSTARTMPKSAPPPRPIPRCTVPPRSTVPPRPRPLGPASNLFSVLATSAQLGAQLGAQKMQVNTARDRPPPPTMQASPQQPQQPQQPQPLPVKKVVTPHTPATPAKISFGLATSADLAAYMQGKPKSADATPDPPPLAGLSASVYAPKPNPPPVIPSPSHGLSQSIYAPKSTPPPVNPPHLSESTYAPKTNTLPVTNATPISAQENKENLLESENAKLAKMVKDFEEKFHLVDSDTASLRREKKQAEEQAAEARADLAKEKLRHQKYCKQTEEHAKKIQEEWEKKEKEWTAREQAWLAKQAEWQQALVSKSAPSSSKPTIATNPNPVPTAPSPVSAQAEAVWHPPYPGSFDRGSVLFLCRLKVDPKKPADVIEVHRNDDLTKLVQMFVDARGLSPQALAVIQQQINTKRVDYFKKEEKQKIEGRK